MDQSPLEFFGDMMGLFSCPKKSDNHWWTEDEWKAKNWTEEEKFINAALPHHMWGWRQNDRIWPFCKSYRGDNAFGPRAGLGHSKYIKSPPSLVKGSGIARWMSNGDMSIAFVPLFTDPEQMWTPHNIPEKIKFYERQPNNPHYGELIELPSDVFMRHYGPSSIQKFTEKSYLVREPFHISWHNMIERKEVQGRTKTETGEDVVAFVRVGMRWDSFDCYYVKNAIYAGLNWN